MRKVRREAQRRKGHGQPHNMDTPLNHVYERSFEPKSHYEITDFTAYSNETFIHNLYKGILKREADPEGLKSYINLLHSGEHSKIEILVAIRFSKEGRFKNVKIVGVKKHYVLSMLYKLPLLGYLVKILVTLVTLPQLSKQLNYYENSITSQHDLTNTKALLLQQAAAAANNIVLNTFQAELDTKVEKSELIDYLQSINDAKTYMIASQEKMNELINEAKKRLPDEMLRQEELSILISEEKHQYDTFYTAFEDHFRGSREEVKQKTTRYLSYIKKLPFNTEETRILDVGCGRGEWIELLSENSYKAEGIDLNRVMVARCKRLDLNVKEFDVIKYLQTLEDASYTAITGFHIIEHLSFDILMKLYEESYRVLRPGGIVIFETPNPKNILVGACDFYRDPTHKNPIPADTSAFLLKEHRFINIEQKSIKREDISTGNDYLNEFINEWVNTAPDYAIIGYKP